MNPLRFCISTGLLVLLMLGCERVTKENTVNASSDSLIHDDLQEETDFEVMQKEMEMELYKKRKAFEKRMALKNFSFVNYEPCDIGIGVEEIKKHGKRKIFDVEKTIQHDSLVLKFRFITDCCLEYVADVRPSNDTLFLSYENIGQAPCDCYCFYNYKFRLPLTKYHFKHLVLGDSILNVSSRR